jgi:hypothetical protein
MNDEKSTREHASQSSEALGFAEMKRGREGHESQRSAGERSKWSGGGSEGSEGSGGSGGRQSEVQMDSTDFASSASAFSEAWKELLESGLVMSGDTILPPSNAGSREGTVGDDGKIREGSATWKDEIAFVMTEDHWEKVFDKEDVRSVKRKYRCCKRVRDGCREVKLESLLKAWQARANDARLRVKFKF